MANTNNQNALLMRAINNVDESTLRDVLKSMCRDSEECTKEAIRHLLVTTSATHSRKREVIELSDSSDDSTQKERKVKKAKTISVAQTSRFETCATCDQTFDVTTNDDTACQTHPGCISIDPDSFPDDDDLHYHGGYGPYTDWESDWRRDEWPEGFIWSCCDQRDDKPPCIIQAHIPKE
ncbi:hypothetical protein F5Y19DRAFT_280504 [Xylariaceae sp. FL1651]|nr:hypothetical protein F5Y19DRAFT_280504 [Xylariaceae sp. FL1651]